MEACIGQGVRNTNEIEEIINVDQIEAVKVEHQVERRAVQGVHKLAKRQRNWPCEGILVKFPEGANHHILYLFGIHSEHSVPWNYRSTDNAFYLQAKSCQKTSSIQGEECRNCQSLTSSTLFAGIMDRIRHGANENVPHIYHRVGALINIVHQKTNQIEQLRMSKLNDSQKLLAKAGALDDHKQWVLAVASGWVDRVASLVQAGLKQRVGIQALIQQYENAAEKLYKPRGYTHKDIMQSIVLLRLGGVHVAQFSHQSLALPSLMTIRHQTVLPALVVSPSIPTVAEVKLNIAACYSSFHSVSGACFGGTAQDSIDLDKDSDLRQPNRIIHQVLMLDELATEKHARWDDMHNKFQGTCREHNSQIPLDFTSERELDLLCEAIENDEVHLATEVCLMYIMSNLIDSLMHLIFSRQQWLLSACSRPNLMGMLCGLFASLALARGKPASNMPT
jgi:hypothetical protein